MTAAETGIRSPGLRRSPRLMRVSQVQQTTVGSASAGLSHSNLPENRRLQFHESIEPVSIPTNTISVLTDSPNFQAERSADLSTLPPHSQEQQNGDIAESAVPSQGDLVPLQPLEDPPTESGAVLMDDENARSGAEQVRISAAGVSQISVKKIRVILRSWDWRQCGKKESLVAKVMLHLRLALLSGKSLAETLSANEETSRYQSWLRMRLSKDETYPVSIDRVPNEEDLIALLPAGEACEYRRKKRLYSQAFSIDRVQSGMNRTENSPGDASTPTQPENERARTNHLDNERNQTTTDSNQVTDSTQFSINEFARLFITIRDDEDAKSAVIAMGKELTRAQLDAGVTRGDFWSIVEARFNDPTQRRFLNLAGYVDGVDSSLPPPGSSNVNILEGQV